MEGQIGRACPPQIPENGSIDQGTMTDTNKNLNMQSANLSSSQSIDPGSPLYDTTGASSKKTEEQGSADVTLNAKIANLPNQAEPSSGERRKSRVEPHEAVRRGLSFGPIKKPSSRQSSITGILKTKSHSPPSPRVHRSFSSGNHSSSPSDLGRLKKDHYADDADGEGAIESSDDDPAESSGDETSLSGRARGRRRGSETGQRTTPKSPLAGPEDQPAVTVTSPEGERQPSAKRFIVHPNTNFDQGVSRPASPNTSDSEELNDIRRAQKMNINSSPIDSSVPHRVIQTIIRGDFASMQEEAEEGSRRLRTYLVATDLSEEAAYALEWTIGTVLRDGDTLLAVYAVDEEVGTGVIGDCLPIGEGAKAIQDTTAVMERMTAASQKGSLMSLTSPLASFRPSSRKSSAANSTDSRALSKAEQERSHALEKLSETCLRFLRKTKLQVRIAIEVIHCKSPKYMVTEAVSLYFHLFTKVIVLMLKQIDGLKPTMVIIGSRGRSALKGYALYLLDCKVRC